MNLVDASRYLEHVGLPMSESTCDGKKWQMMIPNGYGLVMHFATYHHLWSFFQLMVLGHFQEVWTARQAAQMAHQEAKSDWRNLEKWSRGETHALPRLIYQIREEQRQVRRLPNDWKALYLDLVHIYGSPSMPYLGQALNAEVLAMQDGQASTCRLPHERGFHAGSNAGRVGQPELKGSVEHTSIKRADGYLPTVIGQVNPVGDAKASS